MRAQDSGYKVGSSSSSLDRQHSPIADLPHHILQLHQLASHKFARIHRKVGAMAALKCKRGASTLLSETLATLLVWMLQMTSSCAAVTLADGVYEVSLVVVDGVAQQQVKYVGEANTTLGSWAASAERPARGGGGGRKLLADSGVHCQWDANMNSVDLSNAINGLANYFGSGRYWSSNYNVVVGSAVAYACNYGGQQYTVGGMVYSDEFDVDDACANYVGGWYAHESWKSSFGRTVNGWGFC